MKDGKEREKKGGGGLLCAGSERRFLRPILTSLGTAAADRPAWPGIPCLAAQNPLGVLS